MTANTLGTRLSKEALLNQTTAANVLSKISSSDGAFIESSITATKSDELNLNEKSKSGSGSKGSSGSQGSGKNVMVKQCKLKRSRFVNNNYMPSKSSIGGGMNFRESHVPK